MADSVLKLFLRLTNNYNMPRFVSNLQHIILDILSFFIAFHASYFLSE